MFCAIIGDIIDSRKITDKRSNVQKNFIAVLNQINDQYRTAIVSNFMITSGDAFYGLLNSLEHLMEILIKIRLALVPAQIRIGIGIGSINTEIDKYEGNLVDGRANSTAKEAVDYLSEIKNKYESVYRTTFLKVDSYEYNKFISQKSNGPKMYYTYENLINALFVACSNIEKKWDEKQADVVRLKMNRYTQREIADKLMISQPAVQGRLKSAEYYLYEYFIETIKQYIQALWKELPNA